MTALSRAVSVVPNPNLISVVADTPISSYERPSCPMAGTLVAGTPPAPRPIRSCAFLEPAGKRTDFRGSTCVSYHCVREALVFSNPPGGLDERKLPIATAGFLLLYEFLNMNPRGMTSSSPAWWRREVPLPAFLSMSLMTARVSSSRLRSQWRQRGSLTQRHDDKHRCEA